MIGVGSAEAGLNISWIAAGKKELLLGWLLLE